MNNSVNTEKATDAAFMRSLVASVIGIVMCMVCLIGTTWAWYSCSVASGENVTVGANFDVTVTVDGETPQGIDGIYDFASGEHTVTLTKTGTAKKGFCLIVATKSGETAGTSYCVADFSEDGTAELTVKGSGVIKLTPMLGTPSGEYTSVKCIELMPDPMASMAKNSDPTGEQTPENDTDQKDPIPPASEPEPPADAER